MNIEPNYKNKKHYNISKKPIRQPLFIVGLIWVLCKIVLMGKKYKVEKINMENLKPPYLLLSNHMCFMDFELCALGTWPHRVNNVVNVDGYQMRPWLMELIGAVCTRKFTNDLALIKSISRCLKKGDILCMYPEARYSPCGTTSYLPDSLVKLIKLNKVPVVVAIHRGNHLTAPFWNFRKKRRVPLHTTLTQIISAEDAKELTEKEIEERLHKAFEYNEYQYQLENNIKITENYRAEGLHRILYQCPHCKTEFKMDSRGTEIFCTECNKHWNLNEDGTLSAIEGETEFTQIPDWFEWEREQVRKEVEEGTYFYEDKVDVYGMPRCYGFVPLGNAKITQDAKNGFILEGFHNGEIYRIERKPLQSNGLHVEYQHHRIKKEDCFDITTEKDCFYCYPTKENVVTKLAFATEEIYLYNLKHKKQSAL